MSVYTSSSCPHVNTRIVDIHSHLGVYSSPGLAGAADGNSLNGPIVPWVRALDALNTHDDGYALAASGGVTTSLILPGSLNAIGSCPSYVYYDDLLLTID